MNNKKNQNYKLHQNKQKICFFAKVVFISLDNLPTKI